MEQWNFRDGIIPFLIAVAMYGFYLSQSFWQNLGQKWKESQRTLAGWREYEVRIGSPDEQVKEYTADENYRALIAPILRQGFEPVGDYVLSAGHNVSEPSSSAPLASPDAKEANRKFVANRFDVSRIFEHRGYGCIAVVVSMHAESASDVDVQVVSSGSGWVYTSDRRGIQVCSFGMRARDLVSHHGRVSFRVLLEAHLRCRTEIARVGGFTWGAPMMMEEVLRREEQYAQDVRDFARRHSTLSLLTCNYKRKDQGDWLGELQGKVSLPKTSDSN